MNKLGVYLLKGFIIDGSIEYLIVRIILLKERVMDTCELLLKNHTGDYTEG